jgi:predicted alpha/beta-fold hydrolase
LESIEHLLVSTMSASTVELFTKPSIWSAIPLSIGLLTYLYFTDPSSLLSHVRKMLGFGSIQFTSATKTVNLKKRNDNGEISLRALVESAMPPVRLSPLLFNGHLQTIYVASGRGVDSHIHYKRRLWQSDHKTYSGSFTTDWVVPKPKVPLAREKSLPHRTHNYTEEEWSAMLDAKDDRPLLIVLHGLSGGSHEQYIRHALETLTTEEGGFAAVVINARGCCYSELTSDVLFNARATWDIRQVVKWVRKQWPERRLFAMGFSLGANILCNYLGEEGEACEIESAILIGNPWNLDVSNAMLCSTTIGLQVYQRAMGAGLKRLFERFVSPLQAGALQSLTLYTGMLSRCHKTQKSISKKCASQNISGSGTGKFSMICYCLH